LIAYGWLPKDRLVLGRGFGTEHPLEAGASETDTHNFFAVGRRLTDVHDFALSFKVGIAAADRAILVRDEDFEVAADGDIEASSESRAAPA